MPDILHVLDKGYVRLVDSMGSDLDVVRAARVSYNADWRTGEDGESDEGLIKYLLRNKHTTPLEMIELKFEVKAPLFVLRQWHRHRTWSYNEVSARYCELEDDYYVPDPAVIGIQSKDNKQARDISRAGLEDNTRKNQVMEYIIQCDEAFALYNKLLTNDEENGVPAWPRELARMVLPLSTYSRMFAKVDLHNLLHFINLRDHSHAQWEIQQYAKALKTFAQKVAPITVQAYEQYRN